MKLPHALRCAGAALLLSLSVHAHAAGPLPPPVNGITFEEWAAANARLANKQPLSGVLETLQVDQAGRDQANQAFMKALKDGDPRSYTFQRYGEVFADPAVGRFAGKDDQPRMQGKLATFEDYARMQADLSAGTEAGKDPQEILQAHGLTVYEYTQESGRWVRAMAQAAGSDDMERMNAIRTRYEAEARQRYGLPARDED